MTDLAEVLVAEEEGRDSHVYKDSRGYWTIGIGTLVDPSIPSAGLCDAAISAQFSHDSATARGLAADFPGFNRCNEVRQAVLVSMCFQMGSKPLGWHDFTGALAMDNYVAAAKAGRDSDWWRTQTRKRAERAMRMLESGNWVEHE
jgi:lysozyme